MIRISIGNLGSGKTASEVREIMLRKRDVYSNIITKKIKWSHPINSSMIIERAEIGIKKTKHGNEPVYKLKLNIDYWKNIPKPLDVVLDEAHAVINSRRAMSKQNIIVTDWIALLRRILGSNNQTGDLVLITQLPYRIDNIARDMANQIRHHICHFHTECMHCHAAWQENSEMPETIFSCPHCGWYNIRRTNHIIEIRKFSSFGKYEMWREWGNKSWYDHYTINDIEKYFPLYDTLQWDNMFSDIY